MKTIIACTYLCLVSLIAGPQAWGQSFHVEVYGQGKPMILIPGLTSHGSVWDETVARYKNQYECHVITLPGFAGQPAVDYGDSFTQTMRDEILSYIKEKGLEQVTILGHSLGGYMALFLASTEPMLFEQLVIVDGLPFLAAMQIPNATRETAKPIAEQMRAGMMGPRDNAYKAQQRALLYTMMSKDEDVERALQWGIDSDPATAAQAMYEIFLNDLRQEISKIKSPTLVLGAWVAYKNYGATHDRTQASYEAQFKNLEGAKVVLTDKGKHFIMWDDPVFYFDQLDAVLR